MRLFAFITEPNTIGAVLNHLGESATPPPAEDPNPLSPPVDHVRRLREAAGRTHAARRADHHEWLMGVGLPILRMGKAFR